MRIVFFGTSSFAATILAYLLEQKFNVAAVVTRPDAASGRNLVSSSPPVKILAQTKSPAIPIHQPIKASDPSFVEILKQYNPDLFVVVAYGEILRQNILDIPKKGCINIHASLLPKFRGAAPIHRCIMAGDEKTGISIIAMTSQMDAGDILGIDDVPIAFDDTFIDVERKLENLASTLVVKVIHEIENGKVKKIVQDQSLATFAPKLSPLDEKIDWSLPALQIYNQIRAFSPVPGAWCHVDIGGESKRLKIKKAAFVKGISSEPGIIAMQDQKKIIVACGQDALSLLEVQLEGKKVMDIGSFLRGFSSKSLINRFH